MESPELDKAMDAPVRLLLSPFIIWPICSIDDEESSNVKSLVLPRALLIAMTLASLESEMELPKYSLFDCPINEFPICDHESNMSLYL